MFHLVFLLLISIRRVDALICATNCDFSTQIDNVTFPSCTVVNKSSTEHSCQATLIISYHSGSIVGRLDATTDLWRYEFFTETYFSLYDETSNVTIYLGCSTTSNCDHDFVKETLSGGWHRVQSEVMNLRKNLADLLFNSSDLRPHDGCIGRQNCSGEGFCVASYKNQFDGKGPEFRSRCTYSTDQPLFEWIQEVNQGSLSEQASYTCNKPSCATSTTVQRIVEMIKNNYVIPLNVTVPPTTTTTRSSTKSNTTPTTSTSTTPKATTPTPTTSTPTRLTPTTSTPIKPTPTTSTPTSTSKQYASLSKISDPLKSTSNSHSLTARRSILPKPEPHRLSTNSSQRHQEANVKSYSFTQHDSQRRPCAGVGGCEYGCG
ncbi:unnamed protein product [Rotaria sp. Silwood1]|nr:unnamed protein product [Rotaria sp. Silwood1]